MTRRSLPFIFMIGLCLLWVMPCHGQPSKAPAITPDPKIQQLLTDCMNYYKAYDKKVHDANMEVEVLSLRNPALLGPQLIYRTAYAKGENEAFGMLAVLMRIHKSNELRPVMIPFLESNEKRILNAANLWLRGLDSDSRHHGEDRLGSYLDILKRQKNPVPPGLVKYLFESSPSSALIVFGMVNEGSNPPGMAPRDLQWAEHVITTAIWRRRKDFLQTGDMEKANKELETLSLHKGWYARRYVVEIIDSKHQLGSPALLERLKNDPSPLVAKRAQSVKLIQLPIDP